MLGGGDTYGRDFFYNEFEEVTNAIEGIRARLGKRRKVGDMGLRYVFVFLSRLCENSGDMAC